MREPSSRLRARAPLLPLLPVLLLLAVLCLSGGAWPAAAQERPATAAAAGRSDAPALLAAMREHWEGRKSFTARFEQTQQFVGFDEPVVSQGTMRILRPRFFDLTFDAPSGQRQVCDGVYVWTYVPEQKQAIRMPLGPDARRGADLLDWALAGAKADSAQDDPAFAPGAVRLELTPGSQLPIEALRVWVASDGRSILGYEAADGEGNRTRLRLRDVRPDPSLDPGDFRFVPPAGTEVVDLGEGG
ncbi:MAG: outer membrane lipoprotein carrier protein LolA [Candidatus Eisenbacteria bacterium]